MRNPCPAILLLLLAPINYAATPPPIPKLTARTFDSNFVPANLSNGFIGLRPGSNPLVGITSLPPHIAGKRGTHPIATTVGGFVQSHPQWGVETWAPAPYPFAAELKANNVRFQSTLEAVQVLSQSLDMSNGELETDMVFSAGTVKVGLRVLQFASRSVPSLLCQRILITSSADGEIELDLRIDTNGIPGTAYRDHAPSVRFAHERDIDRVLGWQSNRSKLGIALAVGKTPGLVRRATGMYSILAKAGQTYAVEEFAAMVSQAYHPDPELQAIRLARWGAMVGWGEVRQQNQASWAELWKSRVKIDGDAEAQKALDTAFFYLHSNSHPGSRLGVPPYGFSQYNAFYGHVFWDMDSWMFPPLLLTSPHAAKAMLEYRLRGLEAARQKAASFGFRGAQFPWSGALDGSEASPTIYSTGWSEQHIVPDVGIAFGQYQTATQDGEFLRRGTWPVLNAVAEWIESRGQFTARGFEIRNITGVDELLTNLIGNGSHMNAASKMAMQAAVDCARRVGVEPPPAWQRIAREMVIPLDSTRKVVIPYDGAKPGPAYSMGMMHYLFMHGQPVAKEVFRNTYEFEETLRAKLPPSPSNPCSKAAPGFICPPFAAAAAFFGDRHKAADLFRESWQPYWLAPYGLTNEYREFADGSYMTNYGSLLMAAMFGFTGLRINDGDWAQYPATLPEGWTRIEIERIWVRGKPMRLVAENGKPAVLTELKE